MIQFIGKCDGFLRNHIKHKIRCVCIVNLGDKHSQHYDTNGNSNTEYIASLFIRFLHPILLYYLEKTMVNQKQFGASLPLFILLLRLVSWLHIGCNDLNVQNYKLLNNHNSMLQYGHVYFIRNNLQTAFYATVSCSRRQVSLQLINKSFF